MSASTHAGLALDAVAVDGDEAPVNVGVVGLGYWGPNLVRNLSELPMAEAVWMCDLRPNVLETLGRRFPAVRQTREFDEVLDDDRVDAICGGHPGVDPLHAGDARPRSRQARVRREAACALVAGGAVT